MSFRDNPYYYGPDIVFLFAWTPFVLGGSGTWSARPHLRQARRTGSRNPWAERPNRSEHGQPAAARQRAADGPAADLPSEGGRGEPHRRWWGWSLAGSPPVLGGFSTPPQRSSPVGSIAEGVAGSRQLDNFWRLRTSAGSGQGPPRPSVPGTSTVPDPPAAHR